MVTVLNGEVYEVEVYDYYIKLIYVFAFRYSVRGERHAKKLIEVALEGGAHKCVLNRVRKSKGDVVGRVMVNSQSLGVPRRN